MTNCPAPWSLRFYDENDEPLTVKRTSRLPHIGSTLTIDGDTFRVWYIEDYPDRTANIRLEPT